MLETIFTMLVHCTRQGCVTKEPTSGSGTNHMGIGNMRVQDSHSYECHGTK
jgi:hypothetical protein